MGTNVPRFAGLSLKKALVRRGLERTANGRCFHYFFDPRILANYGPSTDNGVIEALQALFAEAAAETKALDPAAAGDWQGTFEVQPN